MDPTKNKVILDADHQGELLVLMSELHTYWMEAWRCGEFTHEDVMENLYRMGNMEGRCLYNGLIQDDLELLDLWKEELDEWKARHGGFIIQPSPIFLKQMDEFHGEE